MRAGQGGWGVGGPCRRRPGLRTQTPGVCGGRQGAVSPAGGLGVGWQQEKVEFGLISEWAGGGAPLTGTLSRLWGSTAGAQHPRETWGKRTVLSGLLFPYL